LGSNGRLQALLQKAQIEGMMLAQLVVWDAQSLSFFSSAGKEREVCDTLQQRHEDGACDGFVLPPGMMSLGKGDLLDRIVPEPQGRGAFRTAYSDPTSRDTFGLEFSPNGHSGN
jgi:alkanesulfonate monooxygenase SsuD/methylene tetrahydromethanopterin reductase-like flavin-dependent oxidoreductase (luciferase family)